jgi:hypothetical protein
MLTAATIRTLDALVFDGYASSPALRFTPSPDS